MALIKCPECGWDKVYDLADKCPQCGYPMNTVTSTKPRVRNGRPIKLPNGYGSIHQLKGRRTNPWRVRKTNGWITDPNTGRAKQTYINIGYYPTREKAMQALAEYNANPYDLSTDITVSELYEQWISAYRGDKEESSIRTITSAWAYCSSVYSMRAKDLRARHIKGCIEDGYRIGTQGKKKGKKIFASASTKSRIKSMFNLMLDYALEYEIVDRNYARTFELSGDIVKEVEENKQEHIIFSDSEMKTLWENVNQVKFVDWILIQCYMGWRPQELATLRLDEVHLDEWYMQAGMKTEAGKQRIVPIHTKIKELVKQNYDFALSINSEYLFNDKGQTHAGSWTITYDKYANRFKKVMKQLKLNPEHRPHDPRKTFITMAKKAKMDEYALKEIVGHSVKDITESTYTVRDLEWLRDDLQKIQ